MTAAAPREWTPADVRWLDAAFWAFRSFNVENPMRKEAYTSFVVGYALIRTHGPSASLDLSAMAEYCGWQPRYIWTALLGLQKIGVVTLYGRPAFDDRFNILDSRRVRIERRLPFSEDAVAP